MRLEEESGGINNSCITAYYNILSAKGKMLVRYRGEQGWTNGRDLSLSKLKYQHQVDDETSAYYRFQITFLHRT